MTPPHNEEFVRLVRQHVEPVLLNAGFVFNEVVVGTGRVAAPLAREIRMRGLPRLLGRRNAVRASASGATTASVLYEADAHEFAAAFPRSAERPERPDCKDLWLHYDATASSIDIDLQSEHVQLRDSAEVVNAHARSLEERVVAVMAAIERFLTGASATN